jgi:hypothetical protein
VWLGHSRPDSFHRWEITSSWDIGFYGDQSAHGKEHQGKQKQKTRADQVFKDLFHGSSLNPKPNLGRLGFQSCRPRGRQLGRQLFPRDLRVYVKKTTWRPPSRLLTTKVAGHVAANLAVNYFLEK